MSNLSPYVRKLTKAANTARDQRDWAMAARIRGCERIKKSTPILVVFPWAFSPRTCSVGKAGTHCSASSNFSSVGNNLPILTGPRHGGMDPGLRRGGDLLSGLSGFFHKRIRGHDGEGAIPGRRVTAAALLS